jgi:hypothetical protein
MAYMEFRLIGYFPMRTEPPSGHLGLPSILVLGLLLGCGENIAPPEGIYTMCREVQGFSGETIELKNGEFRYWFYSDVVTGNGPAYPLKGKYTVSGNTITLKNDKISDPDRTVAVVNGVHVLWRKDGLKLWEKEERIHAYAVLLQVDQATADPHLVERPSIACLKSAKLQDRDRKEHEERFNDQPPEVRVLLRARSERGDHQMDAYQKEITLARAQLDPKLLAQLVGLLGQGVGCKIEANAILEDLFVQTWLIKEPPPFMSSAALRKKAFEDLADALSAAPNRDALESTLMVFLRASGVEKIDLLVPETGHRIKLRAGPNGGGSWGSETPQSDDVDWHQSMAKLIPACQKWMRAQISK